MIQLKTKLNYSIYKNLEQNIKYFNFLNKLQIKREKAFFTWVFHIIHVPQYSLLKLKKDLKKKQIVRYERRTAPDTNLRIYSLFAAIMRHGKAMQARTMLSKVIILLTETCEERSGCLVLNNVLTFLEPPVGLLTYRRGPNFFKMPVPLWPSRKKFIAAKFLIEGARRRQKLYRYSFILALYYETLDVHLKKKDCFTLKIHKKYRQNIEKVENEVWRSKKKIY